MKKFKTIISVITMVLAGIVGLYVGVAANENCPMITAILFSMIAGFACVIYTIDNRV